MAWRCLQQLRLPLYLAGRPLCIQEPQSACPLPPHLQLGPGLCLPAAVVQLAGKGHPWLQLAQSSGARLQLGPGLCLPAASCTTAFCIPGPSCRRAPEL